MFLGKYLSNRFFTTLTDLTEWCNMMQTETGYIIDVIQIIPEKDGYWLVYRC